MNNKLKPCPFCGGEPILDEDSVAFTNKPKSCFQILCINRQCGVHLKTKWRETKQEAIEAWNRRVNDERN